MEKIEHKMVAVNGINMHIAELGNGPTVLLLHGFPEVWYTWRHQIPYLASHGYRAVAPDLRGYGDTTGVPISDPTKFTSLHVVGDLVALIDAVAAPHEDKVFVVGHDWGAIMAWALCLYRPDKIKALVNMSVLFGQRNPECNILDTVRALYGNDAYFSRFQEPGEIEGEIAVWGTERFLNYLFNYREPDPLFLPKVMFKTSPNDPIILPSWLSKEDLTYYTKTFEKTGFTGALNYYRASNLNWELTAPWTGAQVKVPVKFIVGDLDLAAFNWLGSKDYIEKGGFKKDVPLLDDTVILQGVGHFIHEEKPDEINQHIHQFFQHFYTQP